MTTQERYDQMTAQISAAVANLPTANVLGVIVGMLCLRIAELETQCHQLAAAAGEATGEHDDRLRKLELDVYKLAVHATQPSPADGPAPSTWGFGIVK